MWLFAGLAEDVVHGESITRFDASLLDWLRHRATPIGYYVFQIITLLGAPFTMLIIEVLGAVRLIRERRWVPLSGWLAAILGGGLLDLALKAAIHRPRPPDAELFLVGTSWSFPSGHALGSLVGYGMLSYVLVVWWVHTRRAQAAIVAGAALIVLLVGMSRLYLGVHYFSDVMAGWAAGTLWLAACISGLEVVRRQPRGPAA